MTVTNEAAPTPRSGDDQGRWRTLLVGTLTPARLVRIGVLLAVGCLLVALVSAISGSARENAVGDEGLRLASLDFDAAELYQSLNGANASAATGFGGDRTASPTMLARYDSDVTGAYLRLQHAAGLLGQENADAALTERIGYELPRYTTAVDTARALRDQGSPRTQAQLASAQELMRTTLLPTADTLQQNSRAALAADYQGADGFPVVVVLLAVIMIIAVVIVSRREARRTKRLVSVGLVVAGILLLVTALWWAIAATSADGALGSAAAHNDAATNLSQARVTLLQARADETAAIAAGGPTGISPQAAQALSGQLDQRFAGVLAPSGPLGQAAQALGGTPGNASSGTPAAADRLAAIRTATTAWRDTLRTQGPGSDGSRVMFVRLTAALSEAVGTEQGERTARVADASDALTGIAVGPAVLALLAALASVLGLGSRVREYR